MSLHPLHQAPEPMFTTSANGLRSLQDVMRAIDEAASEEQPCEFTINSYEQDDDVEEDGPQQETSARPSLASDRVARVGSLVVDSVLAPVDKIAASLALMTLDPDRTPLQQIFLRRPVTSVLRRRGLADHGKLAVKVVSKVVDVFASRVLPPPPPELDPLQGTYSGYYAIPSSLADQMCGHLGVEVILYLLNGIMGTSHPLTQPLEALLKGCISRGDDFGVAYSRLRTDWSEYSRLLNLEQTLHDAKAQDEEGRSQCVNPRRGLITRGFVPPRRIWDLRSNRVIPWWYRFFFSEGADAMHGIWPISHAWLPEDQREELMTPINGYQWPVPIPRALDLERVRIELLNAGAKFAWLDVLCMRQRDLPQYKGLKEKEVALDIPTIGDVYYLSTLDENARMLAYFNGLGQPFEVQDMEVETNWFNRVWTLQEAGAIVIGGKHPKTPIPRKFDQLLDAIKGCHSPDSDVWTLISEVLRRKATNPVDRVSSLASLCRRYSSDNTRDIPTYQPTEAPEVAWQRLLELIFGKGDILFGYALAGDDHHVWAPSWSQLEDDAENHRLPLGNVSIGAQVGWRDGHYRVSGVWVLKTVFITGIGVGLPMFDYARNHFVQYGFLNWINRLFLPEICGVMATRAVTINPLVPHVVLLTETKEGGYSPLVVVARRDNGRLRKVCVLELRVGKIDYWRLRFTAKRSAEEILV